jgi:hypothetical protein
MGMARYIQVQPNPHLYPGPSQAGKAPTSHGASEIVFTTQSEEDTKRAQKAAVHAMELAFARKKKLAEEKKAQAAVVEAEKNGPEVVQNGSEVTNTEVVEEVPVPVQRTSIKKKTEYTAVDQSGNAGSKPVIMIGDFSSSGTDYRALQ